MNRHQQLNAKQRKWLKLYLGKDENLHGNATRCYKAVYGLTDDRSAQVSGSRLLHHPMIKKLITEATERMDKRIVLDAGFVLEQSKRLYDRAMGDEAIPGEAVITVDPETGRERVTVTERRDYDPTTARHALQMIGQHKSVQAFTQTIEHSHTHKLEQRLQARSKVIEGKASRLEQETEQPGYLSQGSTVPAPTDQPTVEGQERVHQRGGQTDEDERE